MLMSLKLFYCYAHEDKLLRDALAKHLGILRRKELITDWHNRDINAGQEWKKEIDTNLNMADIILLLIIPNFVDSEYCNSIEMNRALKRNENRSARVIPVILRPGDYEGAPFSTLQVLPVDAIPVTDRQWHSLDEAFSNVVQGIRKIVAELHSNEFVSKGNEYLLRKQLKDALNAYEKAIYFNPNNALAYIGKGHALKEHGNSHKEALESFEYAIKIDPSIADAYLGKAYMLYLMDDTDSDNNNIELIIDAYRQAFLLNPKDEEAYIDQGYILMDYGRYAEALASFEEVIHIAVIPDPKIYSSIGDALFHLQRYSDALEAYSTCIKSGLKHFWIYISLGRTLFNLKRYREALDAYEKALALDDNPNLLLGEVYLEKGDILCQFKRYKEALNAYEKAINLMPNHKPKSQLAQAYRNKGKMLQYLAQEALKKADELDPPEKVSSETSSLPLYNGESTGQAVSREGRPTRPQGERRPPRPQGDRPPRPISN